LLVLQTAVLGIATGAFVEERDDWPAAVARAKHERWPALELTAISESLYRDLEVFLRGAPDALSGLRRVTLHAPVLLDSSPAAVAELLARSPASFDVILHPDVYGRAGTRSAYSRARRCSRTWTS
jgi:hypothetical protein